LDLLHGPGRTLDKAKTLLAWARCPAELRKSLSWVPQIEPAYLVQLLEELQRHDVRRAQADSALLGGDLRPADLSLLLAQARALAGQPAPTRRGQARPADRRQASGASVPLLVPIETSLHQDHQDHCDVKLFRESTEPYELEPTKAAIHTATKRQSKLASKAFRGGSDPAEQRRADKIDECSTMWGVRLDPETGERSHILNRCRNRWCPSCAAHRAREVQGWVRQAVTDQLDFWGDVRYAMLTLSCKNVPEVQEVGSAYDDLYESFRRLKRVKDWPGAGDVKFLETTRNPDNRSAHPHLHVLVAFWPEYFTDRGPDASYLPWERWQELWQRALKVNYKPALHIRTIGPTKKMLRRWSKAGLQLTASERTAQMIAAAVAEVAKYPLKYDAAVLDDEEWFRLCARALQHRRTWSASGIFSKTIRGAKKRAEQERKEKTEKRDKRNFVIVWYKWNGWDYIRAKPDQERYWTQLYCARQEGVLTRGGP